MGKKLSVQEKHELYEASVQCPEADIDFLNDEYKRHFGGTAKVLREDFGGTGYLSCLWARQGVDRTAYAIDLDPEPIAHGKETHYSKLTKTEKERVHYIEGNVLDKYDHDPDIIVAFNFSYFIFKKRKQLLEYFTKVRESLGDSGMFCLDLFGGTECMSPNIEETEHDNHTYIWDLDQFNPVTNEVLYYIHFEKDGKRYKKVFTYDWRHWSIPELHEILEEAGFSKSFTYWEEDGVDGEGNGKFYITEKEENCESWVTYIVAIP